MASLLTPADAVAVVEECFRRLAAGVVENRPRQRLPFADGSLAVMPAVDRELLVPDAGHRAALWTPRVWPGALLVGGDVAGTWRRSGAVVTVQPWRRLTREERDAVEAEAVILPLPELHGAVTVRWEVD